MSLSGRPPSLRLVPVKGSGSEASQLVEGGLRKKAVFEGVQLDIEQASLFDERIATDQKTMTKTYPLVVRMVTRL